MYGRGSSRPVDRPVTVANRVAVNVVVTSAAYALPHDIRILHVASIGNIVGCRSAVIVTVITPVAPVTCIANQHLVVIVISSDPVQFDNKKRDDVICSERSDHHVNKPTRFSVKHKSNGTW